MELKAENSESHNKIWGDKCRLPNETVETLLSRLGCALQPHGLSLEINRKPPINGCWENEVVLCYRDLPLFRTAGKGLEKIAADASGLAEMAERIQIGYAFSRNQFKNRVVPARSHQPSSSTHGLNYSFWTLLRRNMPALPPYGLGEPKVVEFYDREGESVLVDEILFRSSTGAASGNSVVEAQIQALAELFERFATARVLLDQIPVPTIPRDIFSHQNQKLLEVMERAGIQVWVKDLSLGLDLPVIGLLLSYPGESLDDIAENPPELEFKTGSATSLDTALARCITEINQHFPSLKARLLYKREEMARVEKLYEIFPSISKFLPKHHYFVQAYGQRGFFPKEGLNFLLSIPEPNESAYWDYSDPLLSLEWDRLMTLCDRNGFRIYLRNFNFLGFPTVRVFVPEINPGLLRWDSYTSTETESFIRDLLHNPSALSPNRLDLFLDPLFIIPLSRASTTADFLRIYTRDLKSMSPWEFFALLARALGRGDIVRSYYTLIPDKLGFIARFGLYWKTPDPSLAYLGDLIPNCLKSCETCSFASQCLSLPLFSFQEAVAKAHPDQFELIPGGSSGDTTGLTGFRRRH